MNRIATSRFQSRLFLEALEDRRVPTGMFAVAAGEGGGPHVKVFANDGSVLASFMAYDLAFRGGVHVATGDVTNDGIDDVVTAPGIGGGPHVRVFDGAALLQGTPHEIRGFMAYDLTFRGGVNIAIADINGDGFADIVTGAGVGGGPHVRVFDGRTTEVIGDYLAYHSEFRGGVTVAAGKVLRQDRADIVTAPGPGGGPHFKVLVGTTGVVAHEWIAYDANLRPGGFSVAVGHFTPDSVADIVTSPGPLAAPHIKVFDGFLGNLVHEFMAFESDSSSGAQVASADVNGDGQSDIIAAKGPGALPLVRIFDGQSRLLTDEHLAYDPSFRGGVSVGAMVPVESAATVALSYDFNDGAQGWIAGFANVAVGTSPGEWQLDAGIRSLPPELGSGAGYMMQGENRSSALRMFLKKRLGPADGVEPGRAYRVKFAIDFGSNMPSDSTLLGGPVSLIVGASRSEPRVVPVNGDLVLKTDYGPDVIHGRSTTELGDIANGQQSVSLPDQPYATVSRNGTYEFTARADEFGNLWLLLGTHSAHSAFTRLYYQQVNVTLLPISQ